MARSSSGKSVARAAATGGGTTYRGQMPVNWYAALVIIVIVGIASIAVAKYNYNQVPAVVEPTVGTSWHAGLAFDICGTMESALPASPVHRHDGPDHDRQRRPRSSRRRPPARRATTPRSGSSPTGYTGLTLTNTTLTYPSTKVPAYKNGEKCAAGTPDAGKVGVVQARTWVISTQTKKTRGTEEVETGGVTTLKPADLKFLNRQLITIGFAPEGTSLPKPPASTITALLQVLAGDQAPVATTSTTAARHDPDDGARRPPRRQRR